MGSCYQKIFLAIGAILMSFASHAANEWHDIYAASPLTGVVNNNVNCTTDGSNGTYATWGEYSTLAFKAAHYDGVTQSWTDITPTTPHLNNVYKDVNCVADGNNGMFATWADGDILVFRAAHYDGVTQSWTVITPISPNLGSASLDIKCTTDGSNGIFATWGDDTLAFRAAHYDGITHDWTDITPTSPDLGAISADVSCITDGGSGMFATWGENGIKAFRAAHYDGANWFDITPISFDLGNVLVDVNCTTDGSNAIFATWADDNNLDFKAAHYDGVNWTDITPISPDLGVVQGDVSCTPDGGSGIFATWGENGTQAFKAAHYDGVAWFDITFISPDLGDVYGYVNCTADGSNGIFATWTNFLNRILKAAHFDEITQSWTDIAPISPVLGNVVVDVSCVADGDNGIFATWGESNTLAFKAAHYNGVSWTDITPTSPDFGYVFENVNCVTDGGSGIFATWGSDTQAFKAAHYDGVTQHWTDITPTSPDLGLTYFRVCCTTDGGSGIFVTWADGNLLTFRAAHYNGVTQHWTDITPSSPDFGVVYFEVSCSTDGSNGIFATWTDFNSKAFKAAHYDGGTLSWSDITPTSPDLGFVFASVNCTTDGNNGIFATWGEDSTFAFRAARFDGTHWLDITPSFLIGDVFNNVNCVTDGGSGMFATWGRLIGTFFVAAHFDGESWTDISPINGALGQVQFDVGCCLNFQNHFLFATWANRPQNFRAAYYGQAIPPSPGKLKLKGFQKKNNFAVVSEQFNALFWKRLSNQVVSYVLKRNGQVITILKGSATSYEDHNRKKSVADTYLLTARDAQGQTIATDTITIKGK